MWILLFSLSSFARTMDKQTSSGNGSFGNKEEGKPQKSKTRNSSESKLALGISVAEVNGSALYYSAIFVTQLLRRGRVIHIWLPQHPFSILS